MKLLLLDMNEMESEEAVHNYLMEKLAFPDYYGKNLDALSDMLRTERPGMSAWNWSAVRHWTPL